MTVKELISKLQQFDENLVVCTINQWSTPYITSVFERESVGHDEEKQIVVID